MSKKEVLKRYMLFVVSLFFIALGIAFTKKSMLGVSPISSVPNVLSCKFTGISLGTWLVLWNFAMIAAQVFILRKDFEFVQLLQIPLSLVFGYFTDFGMWCLSAVDVNSYIMQLLMVIVGVVVLGLGVALSVIANVVMNSGEAFVKAVADKLGKKFGNVKIAVDVSNVCLSIILSLVFFGGEIVGTREGTLITAVFTGVVVKAVTRILSNPVNKLVSK